MEKEVFVQNVRFYCEKKGVKPTNACKECGIGTSFLSEVIHRNRTPSVSHVQLLAQYLGVTVSDLLGEEKKDRPQFEDSQLEVLAQIFEQLNEEGREKILSYANDLASSGNYKKVGSFQVGTKEV